MVASIITLFYCLIVFDAPRRLFSDANTGWHITTGEKILEERQLPKTDPYSFTRPGWPWIAKDWGADCILGVTERQAGLTGVTWIFAIAIGMVTWFWFQLNWAVNGNYLLACLMLPPMLSSASLFWVATPHIFGWIFMAVCVWFFENPGVSANDFGLKHALLIGLGSALWVNLQAGFWWAPVVALLYASSHLLRPLLWNLDRSMEWRRARWYGLAAACALGGSMINPYGVRPHWHAIEGLFDPGIFVGAAIPGSLQIFLTCGIAAVGGMLAFGQKKLAHFFLTILLLGATLAFRRALPISAIVLLPLANGSITDALRRAHDLRPRLRSALSAFIRGSDRLRLIDARLRGLWLAVPVAGMAFLWLLIPNVAARTGFPPDEFPVYAALELRNLASDARLLAPKLYGGYIIYRYQGNRKVFLDGRDGLYGRLLTGQYNQIMEMRPGWKEQVQEFRFTHALLPRNYALEAALEQDGWKAVYRDDTAALLANPFAGVRAGASASDAPN